jgi:hypothetical protein
MSGWRVEQPAMPDAAAQERAREIEQLEAGVVDLRERMRAHERTMPRPPHDTPATLQRFERWKADHDALVAALRAGHRTLANRYLPLASAPPDAGLALFDGHWLPPFEDQYTRPIFVDSFFDHPSETGRFLRTMLLYDRVCLPTVSLLVVPLLLSIIGPDRLLAALSSGEIVLVRYRGAFGYGPNGEGVSLRQARTHLDGHANPEASRPWASTEAVLADLEAEFSARSGLVAGAWSAVAEAVLRSIVEVSVGELDAVIQATYHDVAGHPAIREAFGVYGERLRALPDVPDGQVRWLTGGWIGDGVDGLLHLSQANVETYLAERLGARDQTMGPGARDLLAARLAQAAQPGNPDAPATPRLLDLRRVSDFSAAHGNDRLLERIWRLRASAEGEAFRRWFHAELCRQPEEAEARLIETLVRPTVGDGGGRRPLRYLTVETRAEVDGLLLGRFLRPSGPKVLLDGVRGVLPAPGLPRTRGYRTSRARTAMRRPARPLATRMAPTP